MLEVDDTGLRRKLNNLRGVITFAENIHRSAVEFAQMKLRQETLNKPNTLPGLAYPNGNQYVRAWTGNLKRDQTIKSEQYRSILSHDNALAPYGEEVNNLLQGIAGDGFYQIMISHNEGTIIDKINEEFAKVTSSLNSGSYSYSNPFPG